MIKGAKKTELARFVLENIKAGLGVAKVTVSSITIQNFALNVFMSKMTEVSKLAVRELVQLACQIDSHCRTSEIRFSILDNSDQCYQSVQYSVH